MENEPTILEDEPTLIESLLEKAEDYGKTSYELIKLKTVDKISDVISSLVSGLGVMIIILITVIFLSIGASLWLGELMERTYYGFFIVGGFYAFVSLVYYISIHAIVKRRIINSVISKCLDPEKC